VTLVVHFFMLFELLLSTVDIKKYLSTDAWSVPRVKFDSECVLLSKMYPGDSVLSTVAVLYMIYYVKQPIPYMYRMGSSN
jgi:hypothetical protein